MTTPPTWGTTARLAAWAIVAVLLCTGAMCALLLDLINGVPIEQTATVRVEAMRTLAAIAPFALGAIGAAGSVGSAVHGARHVGGPPAPTSAEMRAFTSPAPPGRAEV